MDKLNFLTAGTPISSKGYIDAFDVIKALNLDGMELEFVHGVRMSEKTREIVKEKSKNLLLTAHGPYYINLNSQEEDKIEASIKRIIETARIGNELGAYSVTYHAAFNMGKASDEVYEQVKKTHKKIFDEIQDLKIWVRPETTGKPTQWGDLDEIIKLSKEFEFVLPCVDFSHLHARTNGLHNSYDEFCEIFEKIGNELGDIALENFHAHIAGIAYGEKGEKHHLILEESDMKYKELLKAFKSFNIKGVIVCESPNIEGDAQLLKSFYDTL